MRCLGEVGRRRSARLCLLIGAAMLMQVGRVAADAVVAWDGSGDFTTIQAAIAAATDGATIVVMSSTGAPGGAYVENLSIVAKGITLRSLDPDDPTVVAATVIDGGAAGRVISFTGPLPSAATIEGLTIRNGAAANGAGINFADTSPTVRKCVIRDNHASAPGTIVVGGAIYGNGSNAVLRDCTMVENVVDVSVDGYGCVAFLGGSPVLERCTIGNNTTNATHHAYAGGLYLYNTAATIAACRIAGNRGVGGWTAQGGGISISGDTSPQVRSCTIANNVLTAPNSYGGGVRCVSLTKAILSQCTIVGNSAKVGAGVWCYGAGTSVSVHSAVVWDNPSLAGPPFTVDFGAAASVAYSVVHFGLGSVALGTGASLDWQAGNIDVDPLFVSPDGPDGDPDNWADNDYHLLPGSPGINAGDPDFVGEPGETDIDGNPRVVGCATDMGSDESPYGLAGDLDADGDADLRDHVLLEACLDGPATEFADGCLCADLDGDSRVDLVDFAAFQRLYDAP